MKVGLLYQDASALVTDQLGPKITQDVYFGTRTPVMNDLVSIKPAPTPFDIETPVMSATLPAVIPIMQTAKADARLTISGTITDSLTGKPINATLQLFDISTDKALSDPFTTTNGSYSAWTDRDPSGVLVQFSVNGAVVSADTFSYLMGSPNVVIDGSKAPASTLAGIPIVAILLVIAAVMLMRKRGKVGAFSTGDATVLFLLIGGVIGLNIIIRILKALGLLGDGTGDAATDPNSAWKPNYWQQFTSFTYAISQSNAERMSETIHDAFTLFNDDFNAIAGVFGLMRTKANVSFLAYIFQQKYNENLLSFLTNGGGILPWDGLSSAHMTQLVDLVKKLPTH